MRMLIVGATGALGREVVAVALAEGHTTVALVRDETRAALPCGVEALKGDVLELATLTAAVRGADAVICVLGTPSPRRSSTLLREGTQNLVQAMSQEGVRRLVGVTLLGAGESCANTSFIYREMVLRLLAPMIPDKEAQERVVRESELEWTLVRPPRFVGGEPRGGVRVIRERDHGRLDHVRRADLAMFLVDCGANARYVRQALAVGS